MSLRAWQRAARLLRTLRWLKAEQWRGRAWLLLRRLLPVGLTPSLRAAPPLRAQPGPWRTPARRQPSLLGAGQLEFLNHRESLDAVGWDDPDLPLLWRYNQHYFDDLNAWDAAQRREVQLALIERWMRENQPGRGTAWAPYPTSLRIANWVKAMQGGLALPITAVDHLASQVRWLSRHLEWHLLGNHLFVNAKALLIAGLFFEGKEADSWRATGRRLIERELDEQILADGGHFERSPMYHALALEDLLDLIQACERAGLDLDLAGRLRSRSEAMLDVLLALGDAAGCLRRFNDSADGIAPSVAELIRFAAELGLRAREPQDDVWLASTGYLRRRRGRTTAWLDLAPIGPDYLPGHAHADTLSFELQLDGADLIVNRGTSVYGDGPRRQLERGTAAHSTAQIEGENSSETWAGFRVGRRARVRDIEIDVASVRASHDGYAHRPGKPLHARRWEWLEQGLRVVDELPGCACVRYHLAPGLQAEPLAEPGHWRISAATGPLARWVVEQGGAVAVEEWQQAIGFGRLVPAQTLKLALRDGRASVRMEWLG